MSWTEQKGQRYEELRKMKSQLSDAERAALIALATELNGDETAFAAEDALRKLHATESVKSDLPRSRTSFMWLWPVPVGIVLGSILLSGSGLMYVAQISGLIGLAAAIVWRGVRNRHRK